MTGKELTIRGLNARGFALDTTAKTSKYLVFRRQAADGIYLVGGQGGLRVCRGKLAVAASISLTGQKAHQALMAVGKQADSLSSPEQAEQCFNAALQSLRN